MAAQRGLRSVKQVGINTVYTPNGIETPREGRGHNPIRANLRCFSHYLPSMPPSAQERTMRRCRL